MQLVKLEDLRIGAEIIIGAGSKLKYLKLLKEPVQVMKKVWSVDVCPIKQTLSWNEVDKLVYRAIKCSTRQDETKFKTRSGLDSTYKTYIFEPDITKHNKNVYINLNDKDLFLVKREQIKEIFK